MFDPWLAASGFVVGALVGLTGVGGGALMTPLLILLFGVRPTLAVGSDLAYATITKAVGSVQYLRRGQVNFPYVRWLIVGSVPASILAVAVLTPRFAASGVDIERFTTRGLGVMLVLVATLTLTERWLYAGRLRDSRLIRNRAVQKRCKEAILVAGGIAIGVGVGLTSVGSGAILMGILLLVSELDLLMLRDRGGFACTFGKHRAASPPRRGDATAAHVLLTALVCCGVRGQRWGCCSSLLDFPASLRRRALARRGTAVQGTGPPQRAGAGASFRITLAEIPSPSSSTAATRWSTRW